jgi:hypothetical protein
MSTDLSHFIDNVNIVLTNYVRYMTNIKYMSDLKMSFIKMKLNLHHQQLKDREPLKFCEVCYTLPVLFRANWKQVGLSLWLSGPIEPLSCGGYRIISHLSTKVSRPLSPEILGERPPTPQFRIPMLFSWLELFFFEFNMKTLAFCNWSQTSELDSAWFCHIKNWIRETICVLRFAAILSGVFVVSRLES